MARAITAEWQLHPEDGRAGKRLVDLFLEQGLKDAAGIAAAAMVLRGRVTTRLPSWPAKAGQGLASNLDQAPCQLAQPPRLQPRVRRG